jgi:hypothetical protein
MWATMAVGLIPWHVLLGVLGRLGSERAGLGEAGASGLAGLLRWLGVLGQRLKSEQSGLSWLGAWARRGFSISLYSKCFSISFFTFLTKSRYLCVYTWVPTMYIPLGVVY